MGWWLTLYCCANHLREGWPFECLCWADSSKKEEHVVSIEDVGVSAADRSPNFVEHGLIDLLLAGLGAVGREVACSKIDPRIGI